MSQLFACAAARDVELRVSTYRTENGAEVDFILELEREVWAIEVKASRQVGGHDLRGLKSFAEHFGKKHSAVIAYRGAHRRRVGAADVWPWQALLRRIFG